MSLWIIRLKELFRYRDLLRHLVLKDVKLKYRRSVLGYFWSVLDPLLSMIVMTIVFSAMFNRKIEHFPVYLFTGQLMFNFMKVSTSQALNSINSNATLIKKAYVPKYIFTFSKIITSLIDLLFTLVALVIIMLVTGARFSWTNLLFPFVLIQLFVFCLGLGLFLAQANVFFKDVQHIYNVVLMAWMYLTPIFYPIESLPAAVRFGITRFNPLYYYVKQFRDIIYSGVLPQAEYVVGGCAVAAVMLILGILSFLKKQDKFILHI